MTSMKKISKSRYFLPMILVLLVAVTGTLAFLLTHTQVITNIFNPSKVTITVEEGFDGTTKTNVKVTNTDDPSKTDEIDVYVRVMLVHNWYCTVENEDGTTSEQLTGKNNWTIKDENKAVFNTADWLYCESDGYYYYKNVLKVGASTSNLIDSIKLLQDDSDNTHQGLEIVAEGIQAVPADAVTEAWGVTVNSDGTISK